MALTSITTIKALCEGVGIRQRYRRSFKFWTPHLECCKEEIIRALQNTGAQNLLVLGAGSLLDFPSPSQFEGIPVKRIHFVDVNPILHFHWWRISPGFRKRGIKVTGQILDLNNDPGKVLKCLPQELLVQNSSLLTVSLNLLSQLSLFIPKVSSDTKKSLEKRHLKLLNHLNSGPVLLITDLLFHYYQNQKTMWQSEKALEIEIDAIPFNLCSRWLWHIAPQGIELDGYGKYHEVGAFLAEGYHTA